MKCKSELFCSVVCSSKIWLVALVEDTDVEDGVNGFRKGVPTLVAGETLVIDDVPPTSALEFNVL